MVLLGASKNPVLPRWAICPSLDSTSRGTDES